MFYPPPSYAVSVWLVDSGNISIAIPGTGPDGKGHRVVLRADEHGLAAFVRILRERAKTEGQSTIGTPGAPTQYDLREVARAMSKAETERKREESAALLKDLGLDL